MLHVAHPSRGLSLRDILPRTQFFGGDNIYVRSVCSDSRQCREGDLFVALVGMADDGHDHIATALERGATAIVAERLLPTSAPLCVVDDTREAFGRICQALAGNPAEKLPTIGVTGSIGKTVTSMLLASIFEAAGSNVGVTSTIAHSDSIDMSPAAQTTPPPAEMATWLARMAGCDCAAAILELSSQALADRRLTGIRLDAAVITNVRRDHLDLHGTRDNYRRAKGRILDLLKDDGFAVVNIDDPGVREIAEQATRPLITVGIDEPADISATSLEQHPGEQSFLITAGNETAAVRSRMVGNQHVYNCLSAAAVGMVVGLDLATVVRGLEAVERVPGRMEPVDAGQPFQVYVDYARTADALALCLSTVRKLTTGRVICVYGAPGDAPANCRPQMGRVAERFADINIITSNDPGWERPLDVANDTLDGYKRPAKAQISPDRSRAIELAISLARPGDAVVITGKGHHQTQTIRNETFVFDDAETARHAIRQWGEESQQAPDGLATLRIRRDIA